MDATADHSGRNLSPHYPPGDNLDSRESRQSPRGSSSPWALVVRGETESVGTAQHDRTAPSPDFLPRRDSGSFFPPGDFAADNQSESSEISNGNSNAGKKPAWSKPSNGAVEVGPVMGAISWPALSESTRVSAKSPTESTKAPADGSPILDSQGIGAALPLPSSPSPRNQVPDKANPNLTPNNSHPARQKTSRRSGGNLTANNGPMQTPATPGSASEAPHANPPPGDLTDKREYRQRESQVRPGQDQLQPRSSFRKGGGSPHHHSYGGRRDHDRGNHHRHYNGRDGHLQPQRAVPRGFVTPPPPAPPPFVAPPVRAFPNPLGFDMASTMVYIPHDPFRMVPFIPPMPPHAMIFSAMDPQLHSRIVDQIDYYFSNENLIKDTYLRQNMDDHGWVPIKLIAGFKKVKNLTDNIQLILDALQSSMIVEVQGDKIRRRNDWMKWIMPSVQFTGLSGSPSFGRSSDEMLASRVQDFSLEETANHGWAPDVNSQMIFGRSLSGELYNKPAWTSSMAGTGQGAPRIGSNNSVLSRNSNERSSC